MAVRLPRYHPRDLWLEWLRYNEARPQRELARDHGLMCASTVQRGMDDQEACQYRAKVAARVKDHSGKGEGEFPLCGNHVRQPGIFVVPSGRLA
jgi:hypothetical protein